MFANCLRRGIPCAKQQIRHLNASHSVRQSIVEESQVIMQKNSEEDDLDEPFVRRSGMAEMGWTQLGLSKLPEHIEKHINQIAKGNINAAVRKASDMIHLSAMSSLQKYKFKDAVERAKEKGISNVPDSEHYLRYTEADCLAYVVGRMHITYAAVEFALAELKQRAPDFSPASIMDYGCGPGTAIWASKKTWPESLNEAMAVDLSQQMLDFCDRFQRLADLKMSKWTMQRHLTSSGRYDLVTCAFALSELKSDENRRDVVARLWKMTSDVLVLVDRGTPRGFSHIAAARQQILDLSKEGSLHIVAPCPHEKKCPVADHKQWCHFSQRAYRNKSTRILNTNIKENHQDSKFSYVVIRKKPRPTMPQISLEMLERPLSELSTSEVEALRLQTYHWPRIVLPPLKRKKHVILDVCSPNGLLERSSVTKSRSKMIYKDGRKTKWGNLWPHEHQTKVIVRGPMSSVNSEDPDQ